MKKGLSIKYKLSFIVVIPILIALYFSYAFLIGRWQEVQLLGELSQTVRRIQAVTQTIDALQVERSALLAGLVGTGAARGAEAAQRKTDEVLDRLAALAPSNAAIGPARTKLGQLRPTKTTAGLSALIDGYGGLVGSFIAVIGDAAKGNTSFGVGKAISTVILLEDAKESAARAADTSLSFLAPGFLPPAEDAARVLSLLGRLDADLSSPAVIVDSASQKDLQAARQDVGVRTISFTMGAVLAAPGTGLDAAANKTLGQALDPLRKTLLNVLLKTASSLDGKILSRRSGAQRTLLLSGALLVTGIALLILISVILLSKVILALERTDRSLNQLARGEFPEPMGLRARDEFGTIEQSLNGVTDTIRHLLSGADALIAEAVAGHLNERARTEDFQGAYKDLLTGINTIIDALVGFFDNMPTPAMVIDTDYRILYMNRAGAALGRASAQELAQTRKNCYDFFKTGDCKTENCACNRAMRLGAKADSETQATPLDQTYDIQYSGVPIYDREGKVTGVLEIITDQTAVKASERRMLKIAGFQNTEIQRLNEFLARVADGDLSASFAVSPADQETADTKAQLDSLSDTLNRTLGAINDILGQVRDAVEQVASGSRQVSQASQALSQGATEQASSLEEITSSVTEIAGQTRQNSDNSVKVNALAADARNSADAGDAQMKKLVTAMNEVNQSAEEIRKIVKAIDDIAFQTNLLALNANVEAARAGKYGKGFAVVAEEVRNLAVRSAASVKETTEMVDQVIKNIGNGNSLVELTARQLATIVGGVSQVAVLAQAVASASREQSQGLEQISTGLNQIDQVTQSNTAGAEQSAAAAEELTGQAEQLKVVVSRFRLKTGAGHAAAEPAEPSRKTRALTLPANALSLKDEDFGRF